MFLFFEVSTSINVAGYVCILAVPARSLISIFCAHFPISSTGLGAAWKTCNVEENSTVAVFGLGAVGLAIIQAAKQRKASRIFAIDVNPAKFDIAKKLGATDVINPADLPEGTTVQAFIVAQTT